MNWRRRFSRTLTSAGVVAAIIAAGASGYATFEASDNPAAPTRIEVVEDVLRFAEENPGVAAVYAEPGSAELQGLPALATPDEIDDDGVDPEATLEALAAAHALDVSEKFDD